MESWGFESVRPGPWIKNGPLIFGIDDLIGMGASLIGGALQGDPEPPRRYPELRNNPIMALAMIRGMMNRPTYNWKNLPSAPKAPGVPNYAARLAATRTNGTI